LIFTEIGFHSVAVIGIDMYKNRKETVQKDKKYIKQKSLQKTECTK
jgi:hypothetical protein